MSLLGVCLESAWGGGLPTPLICTEEVCPSPPVNRQMLLKTLPSLAVGEKTNGNLFTDAQDIDFHANNKLILDDIFQQLLQIIKPKEIALVHHLALNSASSNVQNCGYVFVTHFASIWIFSNFTVSQVKMDSFEQSDAEFLYCFI